MGTSGFKPPKPPKVGTSFPRGLFLDHAVLFGLFCISLALKDSKSVSSGDSRPHPTLVLGFQVLVFGFGGGSPA